MFFIAFWSLSQAKNEGELGIVHCKARLKLNYTKNPSLGELRSLFQINQVWKEENQWRNLTFMNFATPCELPKKEFRKSCESEGQFFNPLQNFRKPRRNFASVAKLMNFATPWEIFTTPCEIFASQKGFCKPCETDEFCNPLRIFTTLQNLLDNFRYFCTDFVRFLSHDILCNYLFFPCN